jgi:hypothetical protein
LETTCTADTSDNLHTISRQSWHWRSMKSIRYTIDTLRQVKIWNLRGCTQKPFGTSTLNNLLNYPCLSNHDKSVVGQERKVILILASSKPQGSPYIYEFRTLITNSYIRYILLCNDMFINCNDNLWSPSVIVTCPPNMAP